MGIWKVRIAHPTKKESTQTRNWDYLGQNYMALNASIDREKHQQQEQLLSPQRIQIEYLDPQEVQKNMHSGSFLGYMSKSLTLFNISTYL